MAARSVCRSREGAWIEIAWRAAADVPLLRRSREGAWIEISLYSTASLVSFVAPVRERGLKSDIIQSIFPRRFVAPVRERGLKYCLCYCEWCIHPGRSREGAWIEIELHLDDIRPYLGRSREGAWIEILAMSSSSVVWSVAPVRERGLKYLPRSPAAPSA